MWAYRKAAWAIEDQEQDAGLTCRQMGRKGLKSVGNMGSTLAEAVQDLPGRLLDNASGAATPANSTRLPESHFKSP